jgi:hypothetical protein
VALGFMGSTLSVFVAFIAPAAVALAAGRSGTRRDDSGGVEDDDDDDEEEEASLTPGSGGGGGGGGGGGRGDSGGRGGRASRGGGGGWDDGWVAGPRWQAAGVLLFGIAVMVAGLTVSTWNVISPPT